MIDLLSESGDRLIQEDAAGSLLQELDIFVGVGAPSAKPLQSAATAVEVFAGSGAPASAGATGAGEAAQRFEGEAANTADALTSAGHGLIVDIIGSGEASMVAATAAAFGEVSEPPPIVVPEGGGGRLRRLRSRPLRIGGRGAAKLARVRAHGIGTLQIAGGGHSATRRAGCESVGLQAFRGTVAVTTRTPTTREGEGYIVNAGEWVVVVEDDDEAMVIVSR